MSWLDAGEKLDVLVGLGNGYFTEFACEKPLLIGGGVGVPPLYLLAKADSPIVFKDEFAAKVIVFKEVQCLNAQ